MIHDFDTKFQWSKGQAQQDDIHTLLSMIIGSLSVHPCPPAEDRNGNDYCATLRRGATILIDAKNRAPGCSRYWRNGEPELALEFWSVMPDGKYHVTHPKTGWTLCEKKLTDLIFFKFAPQDSKQVFLVSYQLLRIAFRRNAARWKHQFKVDIQDSGRWQSEAVFVPANEVLSAISAVSVASLSTPNQNHALTPAGNATALRADHSS